MKEKRTKGKKSNGVVDRQYRRMELSSKFWNKIDPANRFRHWYLGAASITRSIFRVVAAKQTVIILLAILIILYILAAFYTGRGEFVIRLDRPMANEGFLLSETQDFSDMLVTLRNDAVEDATNITITDIAKDVMDVDGEHNGANYVAYTFYLKNKTLEEHDYHYELTVQSTSKNVDTASWIMVFKNGKQQIYAQENPNGYAECIYSKWQFPFIEYAEDPDAMQSVVTDASKAHVTQEMIDYNEFYEIEGLYELKAIPWEAKDLVCRGSRQNMQVNEVDKYTVVIWLEGNDPQCQNDIIGGHLELSMKFFY
ncbi:MAG: hypothetical protein J6B26_02435 [Agathobacter sp.]|nr:hypothetical protein [Agathobacter sp.]